MVNSGREIRVDARSIVEVLVYYGHMSLITHCKGVVCV